MLLFACIYMSLPATVRAHGNIHSQRARKRDVDDRRPRPGIPGDIYICLPWVGWRLDVRARFDDDYRFL